MTIKATRNKIEELIDNLNKTICMLKIKGKKVIRNWCIISNFIWKNLRVSKERKCYYNMNPFTYEYNVNTEEEINKFMNMFNTFAKYHGIYPDIENMIIADYNYKLSLKL